MLAYALVYAALTVTWSLRTEIASHFQVDGAGSRLVVWVEASFSVAAMVAFIAWQETTLNLGSLNSALWIAAALFLAATLIDQAVLLKSPPKQIIGPKLLRRRPQFIFVRWGMALACFTVGVQMVTIKLGDEKPSLYIAFEVGTAVAAIIASGTIFHLVRTPIEVTAYSNETPRFRINFAVAVLICLILMVVGLSLPRSMVIMTWLCLFAASMIFEFAFTTTLSWIGTAATETEITGVVSGTKATIVMISIASYWIIGITSENGSIASPVTVLISVAALSLVIAIVCVLPDQVRQTPKSH